MFIYFFIHLRFLEKDFLEDYLGQWEMEVERMENMSQNEKNRRLWYRKLQVREF